jgi:hypothetical protein
MTHGSAFGHRPDEELGAVLREAFTVEGDAQFVRRVLAAMDLAGGAEATAPWWTVLTAWARPGLVAALLAAAMVGFTLGVIVSRPAAMNGAALGDPLRTENEQLPWPVLLTRSTAPSADEMLAVAVAR